MSSVDEINNRQVISIICPIHNEEETIPIFYDRFFKMIEPLSSKYDFELIFTNNRSEDDSLKIIEEYCKINTQVKVITLSRNFGYEASVMCGLTYATGDAIGIIDVDCEDPPEMIPKFINEWENGYDIIYGIREKRVESKIIQLMRKLFYRLNKLVADSDVILDMAEFSFFSSSVRDSIIDNKSTYPFIRSDIAYVGFNRKGIPYNREKRAKGKTHYNFLGMVQFAIGGVLSGSTFLLRLSYYLGIPLICFNICMLYFILLKSNYDKINFFIFLNIFYLVSFIPILSVYIARIYKDGVQRPLFVVDWKKSTIQKNN